MRTGYAVIMGGVVVVAGYIRLWPTGLRWVEKGPLVDG